MAVNSLTPQDAYTLINAVAKQATGQNPANKVRTPDDVIDDLMKIM